MKITLTGKQVDIGDRLRSHIEENILNSVTKYFSDPIGCNVAFSKEGEEFSAVLVGEGQHGHFLRLGNMHGMNDIAGVTGG